MAKEMTPRERVWTALQRGTPDRVPIPLRASTFLNDIYGTAGTLAYLRMGREFGLDPVFWASAVSNHVWNVQTGYWDLPGVTVESRIEQLADRLMVRRTFHTPAGDLSDLREQRGPGLGYSPGPTIIEPLVKDHGDVDKVRFLFAPPSQVSLADIHMLRHMVGEEGFVEASLNSPLDTQAADILGPAERFLTLYYDDRELMARVLRVVQDITLDYMRLYLESGEKVIHVWWFYASMSYGWSPTIWEEMIYPLVDEQVRLAHSYGALYHYYDDGKMGGIMGYLRRLKVDVASTLLPPPSGDLPMAEAKAAIGDQACLMGGLDMINVLQRGTPELVEATVRQLIADGAPGGGFILDITNSVRTGTPAANVAAASAAVRRYGTYPL